MTLPKDAAQRCAVIAKHEGCTPKQAMEALVAYGFDAWLDSRVARMPAKPASEPAI
jgi:hypothetical protein